MTIYEIDKKIKDLLDNAIDPETGELVLNEAELEQLQMDRDSKIESVLLWIKDVKATMDAMRIEKKILTERISSEEKLVDRLERYIIDATGGQKFKTPKVEASFRESEQVDVQKEFLDWAKVHWTSCVRTKTTEEPDKNEIKKLLKAGEDLKYASLVKHTNVNIK